ncbi:MAG TPA: hypothetical protein VH144_02725 [Candidatus Saccharimonadales bacterium]|jgi:hypothetical protein|nr:hypothetical protein [Candidatus Saccharimonadales bacterium]
MFESFSPPPEFHRLENLSDEKILLVRAQCDLMARVGTAMHEVKITPDPNDDYQRQCYALASNDPRAFYGKDTLPFGPLGSPKRTSEQTLTEAYILEKEGKADNSYVQAVSQRMAPYEQQYATCLNFYADVAIENIIRRHTNPDRTLTLSFSAQLENLTQQTVAFTLDYMEEQAS